MKRFISETAGFLNAPVFKDSFERKAALRCLFFFWAGSLLLLGCGPQTESESMPEPPPPLKTGAEVLAEEDFALMQGMNLGLVVNHTARVDSAHLGDLVDQSQNVSLGAFFAPEHGIRGDADAGEEIIDGVDEKTGMPVYSLHGKHKKPTTEALKGIDALVFDIQDIGSRFYTYISTMGYVMQAAAEANIPLYVLDRPNPLGGDYVAGFIRQDGFSSFVGFYPIPVAHGLTVGELAQMIKGEAYLEGLESLDLRVVEMTGWERSQKWPALKRDWRPTSPNIPDFETALIYAGTCFFEAVAMSEGRGTYQPFRQVGATWANSSEVVSALTARNLAGVQFEEKQFTPVSIEGMSSSPRYKDEAQNGLIVSVSDMDAFDPVATGVHLIHAFYTQVPESEKASFFNKRWMGLLSGSGQFQQMLEQGAEPAEIIDAWKSEIDTFKASRAPYLLYQ